MPKLKYPFEGHLTEEEIDLLKNGLVIQHFDIFNHDINHKLLSTINSTDNITDELFFELLAESSSYLGTVIFQKKISEWRNICHWPEMYKSGKEVAAARSNLEKIGRILAVTRNSIHSQNNIPEALIRAIYQGTFSFLESFFADRQAKPSSHVLKEVYPQIAQAFEDESGHVRNHRTLKEMATRLTFYLVTTREINALPITLQNMRKIIK